MPGRRAFKRSPAPSPEPNPAIRRSQRSPAPSPEPSSASRRSQRSSAPSPDPNPAPLRSQRSQAPSPDPSPPGPTPRSSRPRNSVRFTPDTRTSPSRSPRPSGTRSRRGVNPPAVSGSSGPAAFQVVVPSRRPNRTRSARTRSTTLPTRSRSTRSASATRANPSTPGNGRRLDLDDDPYINLEMDSPAATPPPNTPSPARSGRQTRPGSARGLSPRAAGSVTPPNRARSPDEFTRCEWFIPWPGARGATQCRTIDALPGLPPLNRVERVLPCELHHQFLCHSHRAIQNNVSLPE